MLKSSLTFSPAIFRFAGVVLFCETPIFEVSEGMQSRNLLQVTDSVFFPPLGQTRRADVLMDVGESLNVAVDIGQVEGAFVQVGCKGGVQSAHRLHL